MEVTSIVLQLRSSNQTNSEYKEYLGSFLLIGLRQAKDKGNTDEISRELIASKEAAVAARQSAGGSVRGSSRSGLPGSSFVQAQMDRQKAEAAQTAPVPPSLGQQPRRSARAPVLPTRLPFLPLSIPRRPAPSFKRPPPLSRRSPSLPSLSRRPAPRQLALLSASAPKVSVLKLNPPKPPAVPA